MNRGGSFWKPLPAHDDGWVPGAPGPMPKLSSGFLGTSCGGGGRVAGRSAEGFGEGSSQYIWLPLMQTEDLETGSLCGLRLWTDLESGSSMLI